MKNRSCINWRMLLQKVPILSSMARVKYAKNPHTKHCIWIKELWTFHLLTRKTFMNFDPTGFPRHTEFSPTVLMTLQIKKILHNVVRPFLKLHLIFKIYTIPNKFDKLPYDPEKMHCCIKCPQNIQVKTLLEMDTAFTSRIYNEIL